MFVRAEISMTVEPSEEYKCRIVSECNLEIGTLRNV